MRVAEYGSAHPFGFAQATQNALKGGRARGRFDGHRLQRSRVARARFERREHRLETRDFGDCGGLALFPIVAQRVLGFVKRLFALQPSRRKAGREEQHGSDDSTESKHLRSNSIRGLPSTRR